MSTPLILDGLRMDGVASFYDEVNRVFMQGQAWTLGHSLDALDDLLYGGYGALQGRAATVLVWSGFEHSRRALGVSATRAWLQAKLSQPGPYDAARLQRQLRALEAGTGRTFFELVLQIMAAHPNITLQAR